MTTKKVANPIAVKTLEAFAQFNSNFNKAWSFGTNWSSVGKPEFETFINKYLFPKINETTLINTNLGNRFEFLAREIDFIGQFSEEYVIMDSVPVTMNLSKNEELMLKRNYPKMATKLYGAGILKKQKFTLNNNDVRFNFLTIGDAVSYALGVFKKKISDINITEEKEMRAMMVDYSLNQTNERRSVTSEQELFSQVFEAMLNIQNNSDKYNETNKASGGAIGRYTTKTQLKNTAILTTDKMKAFLLDTKIANTFQTAGLDPTKRIISFDDLGGVFRANEDVTVEETTLELFQAMGDYQIAIGDIIPKGSVVTFDITQNEFLEGKFTEIKPPSELYAYVFDIKCVKYDRNTKNMVKPPFHNGEFDEVTHWIHYYSFKGMAPWYNNILISGNID